ncbi:MAG: agmatinase [Candidatus Bathyarchaeota archaeon]|nr:agmatinase [Candidatus Bathyarchaeota archaeon]
MSYLSLFTSTTMFFSGYQRSLKEARYVVFGVPFDATSTYRSGARFAPTAIREASLNIETYSFRSHVDIEDAGIHDAGDLHVSGNIEETLRRLSLVCRDIIGMDKIPIIIGGEHTLTLGSSKSIDGDFALISFDAHLDLRDKYMDEEVCHATFMRRIHEKVKPKVIVEVGTRAVCREELDYLFSVDDIKYVSSQRIMRDDLGNILQDIRSTLSDCSKIYITLDMDVLDPAFAPAVQNPEPEGLSTSVLLDILLGLCDQRLVAFDIVEVTPHYDFGITSIQAAKIIFEFLSHLYKIGLRCRG